MLLFVHRNSSPISNNDVVITVTVMASIDQEEQKYWEDVEAVKQWWQDSRWRYTKRPFTAEQIVAKRGNLKIEYASNVQSKKLWGIVEERFQVDWLSLKHKDFFFVI